MTSANRTLDQSKSGQNYWRSLEELAQTPEFQELVEREFPGQPGQWTDSVHRRQFLTLMAASLGLAGVNGCSPKAAPPRSIVPYVRQPEEVVPGRPLFFATTMPLGCDALGLLVKSHEGRPTKIEGNPDHPSTPRHLGSPERVKFGATDQFAQAAILSLYDPERSAAVAHYGENSTWEAFQTAFLQAANQRGAEGARTFRLRIVTETITSPSLAWQLARLQQAFPASRWHVYDSIDRDNVRDGSKLAFNDNVATQYHLENADVILTLDADFLDCGPGHIRLLHDFAGRRRVRQGSAAQMNRLYVVESMPSGTGAIADHRLPMRPADVETFARALLAKLDPERFGGLAVSGNLPFPQRWLDVLARDLTQHRGRSLVIAGDRQPAFVHAAAHAINHSLGNAGSTVTHTAIPSHLPPESGSLRELIDAMSSPEGIEALVVLGCNPVYTAPADLKFAEKMNRVPLRIHLGMYRDETSQHCHWHIPEAHFLESWGDARAVDGTVSFIQPLISPLYGGRTAAEVLASLASLGLSQGDSANQSPTGHGILREYWGGLFNSASPAHQAIRAPWERQGLLSAFTGNFDAWWETALRAGVVSGTKLPAKSVTLQYNWITAPAPAASTNLAIEFRPDSALYDGRFANNGWLQELPRPFSKLTWDNAVYLSPATATRLGFAPADRPELANEKVVKLSLRGAEVEGPLWVLPGHADNSVTIHLGQGRTAAGRVGNGVGFNAYLLRTSTARWFDSGVQISLTGARQTLASTQLHHLLPGDRVLIYSGTAQAPPQIPHPHRLSLYDEAEHDHPGNQWGMAVDLSLCTGCSACIVACQAENNIPVVGKEQVERGRAMHWLRIDAYYSGERNDPNPIAFHQPVMCQHCENAPCELVCPVAATVHSDDGLNDMVYNRCVGTRYCSNNCPYKVRRFNFLQYADFTTESLRMMRNPEVTVRSRGVMEKCTYCVQRIRAGEIAAQLQNREILDGEVVTACQAACPAGAIVFGNLRDQNSQAAKLHKEPLHYSLLDELNTRPRTVYLAAMKNPNPEMP